MKTVKKIIMPNGEELQLGGGGGSVIFDTKLTDHILTFEESEGWALQGTYVYKEAVAGSRYGYPDFYNKCTSEKDLGTPTETTLGDSTVTLYVNANGHTFYDIADKEAIDTWYNTNGIAWYYGIDTENERIFLPRTKWFIQPTGEITEINTVNEAGLPNITGNFTGGQSASGEGAWTGAFKATGGWGTVGGSSASMYKGDFDASRSSSIYGNSDTVQPQSLNQLLYICVGNTVVDASHIDVVTQVENGVKDIDDAVNDGVLRLNSIDSLKTTQLTNCLLEVPQRIKLELNDGTLTLKAGSQVIVPNGFEDDGTTPKFDYVDVSSDTVITPTGGSGSCLVCVNVTDSVIGFGTASTVGNCVSGSGVTPINYGMCYNTATNIIQRWGNGVVTMEKASLPLALIIQTDGVITSISQTFNGMGYIGSTVWVDKGVKGLIPNGINEDGTLRNIEFTIENLLTYTLPSSETIRTNNSICYNVTEGHSPLGFFTVNYGADSVASDGFIYNPSGEKRLVCELATASFDKTSISNFQPKQPFHAVDWNDLRQKEIGKPQISLDSNLPSGCVWLEGSTVSRTTYSKLFAVYGTTYGAGDGSTTFVLPDFRNRAIWGSNGFGYLSAGLPNITGKMEDAVHTANRATGAFAKVTSAGYLWNGNGSYARDSFDFNASRCSSIYGNSSTVQPPAIKVRVYTRYQ